MGRRFTNIDFIEKFESIHGKGNYTFEKLNYVNKNTKVIITCIKHGDFSITPTAAIHLKQGCKYCGIEKRALKKTLSTEDFIKRSKKLFPNAYTYEKTFYKGSHDFITITCKKHGDFSQVACSHLRGHGCPKCGDFNKHLNKLNNVDDLINRFNKVHMNKYDYSFIDYTGSHDKIKIICPKHGGFYQSPISHIRGEGCPMCIGSCGEQIIMSFLKAFKIKFDFQKKFYFCRNINDLPFDFYLPEFNMVIEFHGEQHYRQIKFFHKDEKAFRKQRHRDWIKRKFCYDSDIMYYVINYKDNIIEKLEDVLCKTLT